MARPPPAATVRTPTPASAALAGVDAAGPVGSLRSMPRTARGRIPVGMAVLGTAGTVREASGRRGGSDDLGGEEAPEEDAQEEAS